MEGTVGSSADAGSRKLHDFYASFMDETRVNQLGMAPLQPELARIDSITSAPGLLAEIARLHRLGVGPAFFFFAAPDAKHSNGEIANLSQGGIGLPDRDYYFRADSVA
jgi:predicted metalloendopeptidase